MKSFIPDYTRIAKSILAHRNESNYGYSQKAVAAEFPKVDKAIITRIAKALRKNKWQPLPERDDSGDGRRKRELISSPEEEILPCGAGEPYNSLQDIDNPLNQVADELDSQPQTEPQPEPQPLAQPRAQPQAKTQGVYRCSCGVSFTQPNSLSAHLSHFKNQGHISLGKEGADDITKGAGSSRMPPISGHDTKVIGAAQQLRMVPKIFSCDYTPIMRAGQDAAIRVFGWREDMPFENFIDTIIWTFFSDRGVRLAGYIVEESVLEEIKRTREKEAINAS